MSEKVECQETIEKCEDKLNRIKELLITKNVNSSRKIRAGTYRPKRVFVDAKDIVIEENFVEMDNLQCLENDSVTQFSNPGVIIKPELVEIKPLPKIVVHRIDSSIDTNVKLREKSPIKMGVRKDNNTSTINQKMIDVATRSKSPVPKNICQEIPAGENNVSVTHKPLIKPIRSILKGGAIYENQKSAISDHDSELNLKDECTEKAEEELLPKVKDKPKTTKPKNNPKDKFGANKKNNLCLSLSPTRCDDKIKQLAAMMEKGGSNNKKLDYKKKRELGLCQNSIADSIHSIISHSKQSSPEIKFIRELSPKLERKHSTDSSTMNTDKNNNNTEAIDSKDNSVESSTNEKDARNNNEIHSDSRVLVTPELNLPIRKPISFVIPVKKPKCSPKRPLNDFGNSIFTNKNDISLIETDINEHLLNSDAKSLSEICREVIHKSAADINQINGVKENSDIFECRDTDSSETPSPEPLGARPHFSRTVSDLTDESLYMDESLSVRSEVESRNTCNSSLSEYDSDKSDEKKVEKKVHFDAKPPDVKVMRVWSYAARQARNGHWEKMQQRRQEFKQRIADADMALSWVLKPQHRNRIKFQRFMPWWHALRRKELAEKKAREEEERLKREADEQLIREAEEKLRLEEEEKLEAEKYKQLEADWTVILKERRQSLREEVQEMVDENRRSNLLGSINEISSNSFDVTGDEVTNVDGQSSNVGNHDENLRCNVNSFTENSLQSEVLSENIAKINENEIETTNSVTKFEASSKESLYKSVNIIKNDLNNTSEIKSRLVEREDIQNIAQNIAVKETQNENVNKSIVDFNSNCINIDKTKLDLDTDIVNLDNSTLKTNECIKPVNLVGLSLS